MNTEKLDNRCPLCSSPVHYQGLVNVECSGRGCPNFKDTGFFGDVQIDWYWFTEFASWFSDKTGMSWLPSIMDTGMFQIVTVPPVEFFALRFLPNLTRQRLRALMAHEKFHNGTNNPFSVIFDP